MNLSEYNEKIYGIPDGITYGQYERLDEINDRMYDRVLPSNNPIVNPKFDIRSVPTRNCLVFPVLDMKYDAKTKINKREMGYNNDIETESQLRNQYYALQHGADQSIYVPSSSSELYKVPIPTSSNQKEQPYKGLFEKQNYVTTENIFINNSRIGKDNFNNCTKTQLRNTV
jgi:hypothetical protein